MGKLLGIGGASSNAADIAKQRQLQKISNDRQLAQLRRDSQGTQSASRQKPAGRRLFADDDEKSSTLA